MTPPITRLQQQDTHRLIPSRFPPVGVLDVVTLPEDLELIFELEGWTNDRITAELGIIHMLPADEWVVGRPHATAIMAAFCHPAPNGGRFNTPDLGAWYAAFDLETAFAESIHQHALGQFALHEHFGPQLRVEQLEPLPHFVADGAQRGVRRRGASTG